MMTPDNEPADKLVKLAVELDEQLKDRSHETAGFVHPKLKRERIDELTDDEVGELNSASEALEFLEQVRMDMGCESGTPSINLSDRDAELTNEEFGRFKIIEAVGQGGFARVFRAYDPLLNREVALKIPLPQVLVSLESQSRFVREGQAAALLSHPAIVTVFEAGEVGPIKYIASEYCSGETLADWLSRNNQKTDIKMSAKVVARLADAVHHAHQRGVIHRDLKPANILLDGGEVDGGNAELQDCIRVTDFGLAKQMATEDVTLTIEGAVVGTPAYMSPEQIRCDPDIGVTTDVYSMGVILYELLTGVQPHKKSGISATIRAVESEPVKPVRKLRAEVPIELDAICQKCLAKSACDRYPNAFELAADLERFLLGLPVHAKRPSPLGLLTKWSQRNPVIATCLVVTFLSLAGGVVTSWSMYQKSEIDRLDAIEAKNKAVTLQQSETAALGLANTRLEEMHDQMDLLANIFEALKESEQGSFDEKTLSKTLRDNLVKASNRVFESNTDVTLRSNLAARLGSSLAALGYGDDSIKVAERALQLAKESGQPDADLFVHYMAAAHGKHSEQQYMKVIDGLSPMIDSMIESEDFNMARKIFCLHLLANSYANLGKSAKSADVYRRMVKIFQDFQSLPSDFSTVDQAYLTSNTAVRFYVGALFRIAKFEYILDPTEDNLDNLIQVQRQCSKIVSEGDFASVGSAIEVAMILSGNQRFDEALALGEKAYKNSVESLGKIHWQTITAINTIVITCAMNQGNAKFKARLLEMLPIGRDACEAFSDKYGNGHPQVIGVYGNIASAYVFAGDLDSCIEIKRKLIVIAEQKYTRKHIVTQNQIGGLGVALAKNGKPNEARRLLQEFLEFAKTSERAEAHLVEEVESTLKKLDATAPKKQDEKDPTKFDLGLQNDRF